MNISAPRSGSSHSSSRRLKEHPLLPEVIKAFDYQSVPFWLDQGTLLGLVRDGRLIEDDHDLDLGVWEDDYKNNRAQILAKLKREGIWVEAYKPHQLSITSLGEDVPMINIAFYKRISGLAVKKMYYPGPSRLENLAVKAALFGAHAASGRLDKKLPGGGIYRALLLLAKVIPAPAWRALSHLSGRSQYYFKPYVTMAVPEHFFLKLGDISIDGVNLPVPANPEAYLALKYGPDWHKPRKEWVFWEDDGAITNQALE